MNKKTEVGDKEKRLRQEPGGAVLKELEVRAAQPEERDRVRELLGKEHYLGAGRDVGRTLVQVVHHRGRWVALLTWGPAAMKLVDREESIGWTDQQRAQRLRLVVQNRRFLVLSETRMPNLRHPDVWGKLVSRSLVGTARRAVRLLSTDAAEKASLPSRVGIIRFPLPFIFSGRGQDV